MIVFNSLASILQLIQLNALSEYCIQNELFTQNLRGMATKIAVLDCQKMFVEGMEAYFKIQASEFEVVSRVCSSEDLHKAIQEISFEILILDLNIPDQDGLLIIEEVRSLFPLLRILVLSSYTDVKLVKGAMVKGADGYVSKSSSFSELVYALEEVSSGSTYIGDGLRTSPPVASKRRKLQKASSKYEDNFTIKQKLTKRESEILELLTQGLSNKHIAGKLYISDQTVGVHRKNMMRKLGIRNTASLIKFALENHLV